MLIMNASRLLTYVLLLALVSISVILLIDTRAQGMRRDALEQSLTSQMTEIIGLNSGMQDKVQSGAYETSDHNIVWTVERMQDDDGAWKLKWVLHYQPKPENTPK